MSVDAREPIEGMVSLERFRPRGMPKHAGGDAMSMAFGKRL